MSRMRNLSVTSGKLIIGAALGLLVSLAVLPVLRPVAAVDRRPAPVAVRDNGGALEHIVLHYTVPACELLLPTYSQFLGALDAEVKVSVVVEDQAAFDHLVGRLETWGVVREGLTAVLTGFPITPWSRDRYTLAARGADHWVLFVPEASDGAVVERENDWLVPWALAEAMGESHVVRTLPIVFDGGDLLVTETHISTLR